MFAPQVFCQNFLESTSVHYVHLVHSFEAFHSVPTVRFECGHQVLGVLETVDPTAEGVDSVRWASDIGSQNYPLMASSCVEEI